MAKGTEGDWIKTAMAELSTWGPGWLVLAVVSVVFVFQLHKIIPACGTFWKTRATTKQKLRHQQQQFDLGMSNRRSSMTVNKPKAAASKKTARK